MATFDQKSPCGTDFGLAAYRIRLTTDFIRVYNYRCSASDDTLIVYGYPNEKDRARLGLSVSRKIGNAVVRNRWKRRIREAFRLHRRQIPTEMDYIVLPQRNAHWNYDDIVSSLIDLTKRVYRRAGSRARR